jgi:Putative prokaryotic signal transducing protein
MDEQDKIVVLKIFENSIDANLARTKLDAYGIQCFLTEENVANLFPMQSVKLFGVRLHVFKNDQEQAGQILIDQIFVDREELSCPRCLSIKVDIEESQKLAYRIFTLSLGLLSFLRIPIPKVYRCQDCQHEF